MKPNISPLNENQLAEADRIFRLAFGTRNQLPDPMKFDGDAERIKTRFRASNVLSWGATVDGSLIGTAFGTVWGNFAWLGPLSVHPDQWNNHIAQHILEVAIPSLDKPTQRHQALFTVAESAKHLNLYRKYGYYPWFLTMVMEKNIGVVKEIDYIKFSAISDENRTDLIKDLKTITDTIYEGLDLSEEILAVFSRNLGDTIVIDRGGKPSGFAVCHFGPGTEATSNKAYVKFAAVKSGKNAPKDLEILIEAIESCVKNIGLRYVNVGVNSGRRAAYGMLLNKGYRSIQQGIAMHRPDEPAYDKPEIYALDDWR